MFLMMKNNEYARIENNEPVIKVQKSPDLGDKKQRYASNFSPPVAKQVSQFDLGTLPIKPIENLNHLRIHEQIIDHTPQDENTAQTTLSKHISKRKMRRFISPNMSRSSKESKENSPMQAYVKNRKLSTFELCTWDN